MLQYHFNERVEEKAGYNGFQSKSVAFNRCRNYDAYKCSIV